MTGNRKGEKGDGLMGREVEDETRGGRGANSGGGGVYGDTEHSSFFKEPGPTSWVHMADMGMIMWGVIRADGGSPRWGSMKEWGMSSLCPRLFFMARKGERDLMSFADHDLTMHARTEPSGKRRGDGGTSLPDRVEATMGAVMYMETLATDDNTWVGREALRRVGMQWGRQFQQVKEGVYHFYATNERVVETDAFQEKCKRRFNADLMRLGEAVRMATMKLKQRDCTWPAAKMAGPLP